MFVRLTRPEYYWKYERMFLQTDFCYCNGLLEPQFGYRCVTEATVVILYIMLIAALKV